MGIGGLAVRPSRAAQIEKDLLEINRAYGVTSEVMWKCAKARRDDIYRAFIDLLFHLVEEKQVHLHLRFSPITEYDHNQSGPRRNLDTVSKAFYQVLLHRAGRFYGHKCKILVRPDNGSCTSYLPKMLAGLNADTSLKYGYRRAAFATIEPCDSRNEIMLQLLDVTLGALTSVRNGNHENGTTGPYKSKLAAYALERSGVLSITDSHPQTERRFNIWNVQPKWTRFGKNAAPKR